MRRSYNLTDDALADAGSNPAASTFVGDIEIAWLAGLLEGEGSFVCPPPSDPKRVRIMIEMSDLDVIERVSELVGLAYTRPNLRQAHWQQSYKLTIRGAKAVEVMRSVYPFMSLRRRGQIDKALASISLCI
jgi:hypothetical protein